jgi:hypothetical protein
MNSLLVMSRRICGALALAGHFFIVGCTAEPETFAILDENLSVPCQDILERDAIYSADYCINDVGEYDIGLTASIEPIAPSRRKALLDYSICVFEGFNLDFQEGKDTSEPINTVFIGGESQCNSKFNPFICRLGQATTDFGNVRHDDRIDLTISYDDGKALSSGALSVSLVHEIGHVLGLLHNDVPGSLMYSRLSTDPASSHFTEDELHILRDNVGFDSDDMNTVELRTLVDRPQRCMRPTTLSDL